MEQARTKAEIYRNRAVELRAIAEVDRHAKTHDTLMKLAADYDMMALQMDGVADSKAVLNQAEI